MSDAPARFPWWIPVGAAVIALGFARTLAAPFDFIDDGNLVYPAPAGTGADGHARIWWANVVANVEHLGPFRPTLWLHWHAQANLFGADPLAWRAYRLAWCALAAAMLLWLLRELRVPAVPALFATAAAVWNPYRSEIWTSLTLAEGVAMPYALFALVAARRAAHSARPLWWDVSGALAVLIALGCKNTFAALVPAQMLFRLWPDDLALRAALKRNGVRAAALAVTLALPVAHFVYFKLNWHPGQYEPAPPSPSQALRVLNGLKGAVALDLMGAGLAAALVVALRARGALGEFRAALAGGAVLVAAGAAVYLPMSAFSGRYSMPAVWGLDVLFAVLLTALWRAPRGPARSAAIVLLCAGLAAVLATVVHRQDKTAARAKMLWAVVHHLEATAPRGATVAWVGGDPARGALGEEEGIHVQWHLANRGRADLRIVLLDATDKPLARVEVAPAAPASQPALRVNTGPPAPGWTEDATFATTYQLGRKRYECATSRPAAR
ncbi:MAG: hypothetical protein FJ304_21465 [Planctomycetes bacterium]|nr:hypothetical protein [Planctomycetota bacterium]